MSTDRELLELAMKAYADPNVIKGIYPDFTRWIGRNEDLGCDVFVNWNPLTDDGDALRLAVKLKLEIKWDGDELQITPFDYDSHDPICCCGHMHFGKPNDRLMRECIVNVAAAIGEQLNEQESK